MKVIDKLGKKLAKDFNKEFKFLNEEQLKVIQNTKLYQIFSNKGKLYSKTDYRPEFQSSKPRHSSSTDLQHIKMLEIFTELANKKVKNETVKELLDSKEASNIIIAANIVNNKYK